VFLKDSQSSINSYGYSPFPLSQYIEWIDTILTDNVDANKPIIISIAVSLDPHDTGDSIMRSIDVPDQEGGMLDMAMPRMHPSHDDLIQMIRAIQELRKRHGDRTSASPRIAIEINTSCPNLPGHPPPAYDPSTLRPILETVAEAFYKDPSLAVGLKLPPYVHSRSFVDIVDFLASFSNSVRKEGDGARGEEGDGEMRRHPVAFITCTNTLGSSLLFEEQTEGGKGSSAGAADQQADDRAFALPSDWGGLAGEMLHPLALGNVHSFSRLLQSHPDEAMRQIAIIGVGGVTSAAAAKRMINVGASAVGCATVLGKKGVSVFEDIVKAF